MTITLLCRMGTSSTTFVHRLLDILAGHKSRKGLSGVVLINGENQPVDFRFESAYVPQVNINLYTDAHLIDQCPYRQIL